MDTSKDQQEMERLAEDGSAPWTHILQTASLEESNR
jgi:hypothetical protein